MNSVEVKTRIKEVDVKNDLERRIDLPTNWGLLSHLDNINYCIEQIREYSEWVSNPVIGYVLERGWGTREALHRILPQEEAKELKKTNPRFDYFTLNELLKEKLDIKKGKYIIEDGQIIDFNPNYSE